MNTVNDRFKSEQIAHSLFAGRYSSYVAKRMVNVLNAADDELMLRLVQAMERSRLTGSTITEKRILSLLKSVRDINKQAINATYSTLTDELLSYAKHEAWYQQSLFDVLIDSSILKHYPLQGISEHQVYAAAMSKPFQGKLLSEWFDGLEKDRMKRIENTVRVGYLAGDSAFDIGKRIIGHVSKGYQDGALQMSRANATSIAKTALNHFQAEARDQFYDKNDAVIDCKEWLSTLDNKTTHICIIRDKKRYTLDNKPIGHKIPYKQGPGKIHFNCRSTEVVVTKSWRELGIDIDEMPEGTRSSMNGQVPAGWSYTEWLEQQPDWRQKEILGGARYRMYKQGKKLPEFYTDKGELLTLDQLKRLDERAINEYQ